MGTEDEGRLEGSLLSLLFSIHGREHKKGWWRLDTKRKSSIYEHRLIIPYLKYLEPEVFQTSDWFWTLGYLYRHNETSGRHKLCETHNFHRKFICFIYTFYTMPEGNSIALVYLPFGHNASMEPGIEFSICAMLTLKKFGL